MIVDIISENFPFTNNYYHIPKNQRGNFNEFVIDIMWLPYYISNIKSLDDEDDLNISYDENGLPTNSEVGHGIGTSSIRKIAEENKLLLSYDINDETFTIKILF